MSRRPRERRPQLACILADNSDSMAGAKAKLTTNAVRELLLGLQVRGPRGPERSYYRLLLVKWGAEAALHPSFNMVPVRQVDPDGIVVLGDGGASNMANALEIAYAGLERYLTEVVQPHPEREKHPLPVVLVFSDGWNQGPDPTPVAERIKALNVDGDSVLLATVGVAADVSEPANEELLRSLASPSSYLAVTEARFLSDFFDGGWSSKDEDHSVPRRSEMLSVIERLRSLRNRDN